MGSSAILLAKRALVVLIRALALTYGVTVNCNRDSNDSEVLSNFRKVALRVHPDRGGNTADQQKLNDARGAWDEARKQKVAAGRPKGPGKPQRDEQAGDSLQMVEVVETGRKGRGEYRVRSHAALLTYMGLEADQPQWESFCDFCQRSLNRWGVKHWCATLETTKEGKPHFHLMLQFARAVDRTTAAFAFEGLRPNARPTDLCGEGLCRKKMQVSIDRGFFYVWADKEGTVRDASGKPCVEGNYAPVWTDSKCTYQVLGAWPEKLWKQRKLSTPSYRSYLFLTRDGLPGRKRNLDEADAEESRLELQKEVAAIVAAVRSDKSVYQAFEEVPEATAWLKGFQKTALRYPIMVVLGESMSGKTEWAKSLFSNPLELKVGALGQFPDRLRSFDRKLHDGIVLDDVRDLAFVTDNQDRLQGKYDAVLEFATTPGGQCKFEKYLFKIPVAVTANYSTQNLSYLESHDWLGKPGNRTVVHYKGRYKP